MSIHVCVGMCAYMLVSLFVCMCEREEVGKVEHQCYKLGSRIKLLSYKYLSLFCLVFNVFTGFFPRFKTLEEF